MHFRTMYPRVKICCISSTDEANMAVKSGAAALGLVGQMPSGPGIISDEAIHSIAKGIPPGVASFLLTSHTTAIGITAHHQRCLTNTIQIVDTVESGAWQQMRQNLPGIKLVQVIHVINEASVDEALQAASLADALLLDSGNPFSAVKELGGTGRVHNWQLSRQIVEQAGVPVYLAGGLHAGNVREALETVRPFGVDLCSGVRSQGRLDPRKLDAFMQAVFSV